MIVKQMVLVLTAAEIGARIGSALAGVEQISEPSVRLAEGRIELNGVFKAGLSIPFGTVWSAEVRPDNALALRLAEFKAGPFGGGAMGGRILEMLAAKLAGRAEVKVDGDCLVIALKPLLAQAGIELAGTVSRLTLTAAGLEAVVS